MSAEFPAHESPATHQSLMAEFLAGDYDSGALTAAEAVGMLSYPDAPLDERTRAETAERSMQNESTVYYAMELQQMCEEVGTEKIIELAGIMRDTAVTATRALGIEPSPYAHSVSWALWDMAKQRYTSKPEYLEEAGPQYPYRELTGNPLSDPAVRQTIVNRYVGWEVDARLLQPGENPYLFPILGTSQNSTIDQIRNTGRRNEKAQVLNSLDLARVGEAAIAGLRARRQDIPRELNNAQRSRRTSAIGTTMLGNGARPVADAFHAAELAALRMSADAIHDIPELLEKTRGWSPTAPIPPAEEPPITHGDIRFIPVRPYPKVTLPPPRTRPIS